MTDFVLNKTYSPLTSDELIAKVKANMDQKRFEHCLRVSDTSRKLAALNHYDEDKAALAGFVHDYAKQVPKAAFLEVIQEQGFDRSLCHWNRAIWHGFVGWYFVKRDLKIDDLEILMAIKRHTVGDVEMTTLDKIVFVADFIEPGREFDGVVQARRVSYASLDQGVGYELAHTLTYLISQRDRIFPQMLAAYNVWSINDN